MAIGNVTLMQVCCPQRLRKVTATAIDKETEEGGTEKVYIERSEHEIN